MLTLIQNYNMNDVVASMQLLLEQSSHSTEVRDLAVEITAGTPSPINAIFNWIKKNVNYVSDPVRVDGIIELFISPVRMVQDYKAGKTLGGDCDDQSLLATALYRAIGMPSNVVLLNQVGRGYDHAVSRVYSEKLTDFIMVDPTADLPLGWREFSVESKIID